MPKERTGCRGIEIQPADEVLRSPSIRTLLATALVALGVVLFCNAAAGRLLVAFPQNDGYAMIKGKWNLLTGLTRPVDVLVLGDSSCSLGIDPGVIEGEIGGTALNLCTIGDMTVVGSYWMLDHYIQKFGPPETVIVGHVLNIWQRSISPIVVEQIPVPDSFVNLYTDTLGFQWRQYFLSLVAKYIPFYAENQSLARILTYPWRASHRDFAMSSSGFTSIQKPDPHRVLEDAKNYRRFVRKKGFRISRDNQIALDNIAHLAEEYEFDVFFVVAPMYEGLISDPEVKAYIAEQNTFFENFSRRHPHFKNVFSEPMLFSEYEMENADHVILSASPVYTRSILKSVEAIRRRN